MPHEHHHHDHSHNQLPHVDHVPELLAPAGGPAAFDAALAAGADAIFVGYGQELNARRGAESLSGDNFEAHVRKAHLAGTRVYVTTNIVVRDDELPRALAIVREAWVRGADAFIVQDLGLAREIHLRWPEIELHASTQMNVHDTRGVAWCAEHGMTRVTLSRELSITEIEAISQTGVELEGFAHGALCFCYSGICLMSQVTGARSANRGMCAQPCRLLYTLVDEDGHALSRPGWDRPLCPKDLCSVDHLRELRDAGLGSLKVEGRLKAPDYVLSVVSAYREALDALALGRDLTGEERASIEDRLRRSFNRDFTDAYLVGRSGNEMMSFERSNNRGELVGEVVASRDLGPVMVRRGGSEGGRERFRRLTRAEVTVELTRPVGKGDLLEVRPDDDPSAFLTGLAEADAAAGERITIKTARPMAVGCPVRVIRSQRALDAAAQVNAAVPRRRAVAVDVQALLGRPLSVELAAFNMRAGVPTGPARVRARAEGPVVEAARTREVSFEELREHVLRMGASPFEAVGLSGAKDPGIGMAFSAVHRTRADACATLEEALLEPWAGRDARIASAPDAGDLEAELESAVQVAAQTDAPATAAYQTDAPATAGAEKGSLTVANTSVSSKSEQPSPICVLAPTPEVAAAAREAGATRVYATADDLAAATTWPAGTIPWLDEVCREGDHARLDPWVRTSEPVAVGNISELAFAKARGARLEVRTTIPVHNRSTLVALADAGAVGVWLSGELSLDEVTGLARFGTQLGLQVGFIISGRERVMTSEHCILQVAGRCKEDCASCELRARDLALRDKDGRRWPVRTDRQGRSRIYAPQPLDATPQVEELLKAGVSRLMVDATLLSAEEAARAVRRVQAALEAVAAGQHPAPRLPNATSGHLFNPIL